jgi:predicted PurR-regulated permease PerM
MKLTTSVYANRLTSGASKTLVAAIVVAALYFGRQVLMPIALAGLLSFILTPLVRRLQRLGLGRIPSVAAVTLLSFTLIAAFALLVGSQVTQLATDLPKYQSGIEGKIKSVREQAAGGRIVSGLANMMQSLGAAMNKPAAEAPAAPQSVATLAPNVQPEPPPMPVVVRQPDPKPYEIASQIIGPIVEPLATAGIVMIFVVFILLQREDLRDRLIWFAGSRDLRRTTSALDDAGTRLSRYFLAQTAINATFGLLLGTGLWMIGIPNFVLWGAIAALLRFLPYIGGILSAFFPLILAAAVDPGWTKLFWTAGLYAGLELTTGQIVEPLLFGHTTGMSPLAVITAATFWTWVWGPIGLMLSTPLTLLLVVLGQHVQRFSFFAVLLGDAPPLAPEESFYHKIISGRADEAADQAYALLKEQELVAYYDKVALPGLRMLQSDLNSGATPPESLARMTATVDEFIELMDEREEAENAEIVTADGEKPAKGKPDEAESGSLAEPLHARVLCISGRSPFDRSVAAMLKQLLARHRIGLRIAEIGAASSGQLFKLDTEGVAFVCLSYLAVDHSPSHTRFLIRRLRRRLPDVKILAGFWTYDEDEDPEALAGKLKSESGADMVATTLEEVVAICLRETSARHSDDDSAGAKLAAVDPGGRRSNQAIG